MFVNSIERERILSNPIRRLTRLLITMSLLLMLMQLSSATISANNYPAAFDELNANSSITRELKKTEEHRYTITLTAQQYLHVVVEQQGIDLVVKVIGPMGEKIDEVDSPNGNQGPEPVFLLTEQAGIYQLIVAAGDETAAPGRYQIKVLELRAAVDTDKDRVLAQHALLKAQLLSTEKAAESINRAIELFNQAITRFHNIEDRVDEANASIGLANIYLARREYARAEPLFLKALAIREQTFGSNHTQVAITLIGLAALYDSLGDSARAEPIYQRALTIEEQQPHPDYARIATLNNNLALLYDNRGEYAKSEKFYQRGLALREQVYGAEHASVATLLNNMAVLFIHTAEYQKAEPLLVRAVSIREQRLGINSPLLAISLNSLAEVYRHLGKYAKAELLYLRSLEIREKVLGKEDPDVATSLNNLAFLYDTRGEYTRSEPLYQRALKINLKVFGADAAPVATALHNLAGHYNSRGEFARSEPLYQRALAIREKVFGPEHILVGHTLNNLAHLYMDKGDYAKAEPLLQRALKIQERVLGPAHPDLASSLSNMSQIYQQLGDYQQVEALLQKALTIKEKVLGAEHPDVAGLMCDLAYNYGKRGQFDQAVPLLEKAIAIYQKALGMENPNVATSLSRLASIYYLKDETEKAAALFQQALSIKERVLGAEHREVATSLIDLAELNLSKHDIPSALSYLARGNEIREHDLISNLVAGSEKEKLYYLNLSTKELDLTLDLHSQSMNNKDAARIALTLLLRRKGRALDAMTDSIAMLRERASDADRILLDKLGRARTAYSSLMQQGTGKTPIAQYQINLRELEQQIEKLESEISARSAELNLQSQSVTLEAIQQALPADAALVEFAVYHSIDRLKKSFGPRKYVAFVLKNSGEPLSVQLGDAETIEQAVSRFRSVLMKERGRPLSSINRDVKPNARRLDQLVMRPIRRLLGNKQRLLLSPDGALNLVPFDAFVDENGRYLIQHYEISYLTSGRDLLRATATNSSLQPPLIIADPDYGSGNGPILAGRQFGSLPRLTGTAQEAASISNRLPEAKIYQQQLATKQLLMNVERPEILHIATHGAFLPADITAHMQSGSKESRDLGLSENAGETNSISAAQLRATNPLLRSFLFFAGANDNDNGVMTALEAANLNLFGTKLVVLSACETGLGEIKDGDGVFGLRRALVLAGAETQLISLWSVDDQATRDLMIGYYRSLKAGEKRSTALRKMQLQLLLGYHQKRAATHTHPYYWASFIQSGRWTKL